jgi:transposase
MSAITFLVAVAVAVAVGIDIAKASFDAARLGADGKRKHKKFDDAPDGFAQFTAWLAGFGGEAPHLCMESTGACSLPLAEHLIGQGLHVSVVNPAKIAAFAKSEPSRAKPVLSAAEGIDKADAKLIARYALAMRPSAWTPPPPEILELQALLRRVEHLLEMRRMERNRLDTANPAVTDSIQAVLALLEQELEATRDKIRQRLGNHPDLKRRAGPLESIPGVGQAAAAWLLTLLGERRGFTDAKQAAAFAGLAPRLRQSGRWAGQTRIAKTGDPSLRKALYMPILSALAFNPAIRDFRQRLKANGKAGKAYVCAAMRKIVHIAFAILKSGKPFDPHNPSPRSTEK